MMEFIYRREHTKEELMKFRMRIGCFISGLTLPFIIGIIGFANNNFLFVLIYFTPLSFFIGFLRALLVFAYVVNIIGLGLIFFSIKPRSQGFFLIILGYLLFMVLLLNQTPVNRSSIQGLPYYFIFIDMPNLLMIVFGFYKIYNSEKEYFSNIICFLPVLISNISPYIFYLLT